MIRRISAPIPRLPILILCSLCLCLPASSVIGEQAPLFDPDGYRIDGFRGPVPNMVPGAATVTTEDVKKLLETTRTSPVLIDVLPSPPKPKGLAPTSLWLPPTRHNIPGSVWLPNVGYGRLSDALDRYFQVNLERLTGGDKSRSIVIYCLADCWMSWNAARRAAEYGYSRVLWYPKGTDGWEFAEHPLEAAKPLPME